MVVRASVVTAEVSGSGGARWTYTTVVADAPTLLPTVPNRESSELRWVAEDEVAELPLHPGFAASWRGLRAASAPVPLAAEDERRHHLPRTLEIEAGVFVWCTPADPDSEPAALTDGSARCCQRRAEPRRRGPRVLGAGDRPHHHHPACPGVEHLRQPLLVDAADREPRLVASAAAARTRSRPGAGRPGLVGVGQHGPTQK